ncbi:MAG: hypothetical protein JXA87_14295, partial [Thermoleophilia bacterium]|nr:hypothetical protein [Thermoleophilia bacterium]
MIMRRTRSCLTRRTIVCAALFIGLLGVLIPLTLHGAGGSASAQTDVPTWAKTYRSDEQARSTGIFRMPGGDLLVTAWTTERNWIVGRPLLLRLSPEGEVRWSKSYSWDTISVDVNEVVGPTGIPCSPSGMMLFGGTLLCRLDESGNVLWARQYRLFEPPPPSYDNFIADFKDVVQLADGGFVACGRMTNVSREVFLCRLDGNGTPLWARSYAMQDPVFGVRMFALEGNRLLLVGDTFAEGEKSSSSSKTSGIKLMWLGPNGEVERSRSYVDTNPDQGANHMYAATMTSNGPVFVSYTLIDKNQAMTVTKLDPVGNVQWSTGIAGTNKGWIRLRDIDAASNGSLVLVGDTDEFDRGDRSGPHGQDGLVLKLSPHGTVEWMALLDKTVVRDSQGVTAMDDGGLTLAASMAPEDTTWSPFVTRMSPDGMAGNLRSCLIRIDPGNERLVRIERVDYVARGASSDSQPLVCEWEDAGVAAEEMDLAGQDIEGEGALTLQPLYPADAATPSTIMPGGTMHRYYRVLDAHGYPVEGLEIRYYGPFSIKAMTATSDETGEIVFSFAVPESTEPQHLDGTLTIDSIRVTDRRSVLATAPDFATDVLPLSWSTNWMMGYGIAGKAGLGLGAGVFGAGQQTAGMVLTRTEADPANQGNGSMTVTDSLSTEAAIGVQGEAGKLRLGTVEAKGPEASSKLSLGAFIDFATLFDEPGECSISEKLMAALTLLVGVEHCASAGVTTLLSVAQSAIVSALSDDVEMEHLTGGVSIGMSAGASMASLSLAKKGETPKGYTGTTSLSGVSFLNGGLMERALLSITAYPGAGEASGKAAVEASSSFSAATAFGYDIGDWSASGAVSTEVIVDPLAASFKRTVVAFSEPPDDRGECQETRLTADRSLLSAAADALFEELKPLVPGATLGPDQRIVFTEQFGGEVLRSIVAALSSVMVPYEHLVTMDRSPASLEVGLGVSIAGTGFDLAVTPAWGRYKSYPLERGLFVVLDHQMRIGRMVVLEEYPTSLFSSHVDTLPNVIGEILAVVGELLSAGWDLVTGTLSSASDTFLSVGAGAGGAVGSGASALFEAGTTVKWGSIGAAPRVQLALAERGMASDAGPALFAATSTRKVTLIGTPSDGDGFSVDGIYILEPESGTLSKPATLTLSYSPEAARGRDQAAFSIYHYDPDARVWTPVDSIHDRGARTLTVSVTELGGYCIGSDGTAPEFTLLQPMGTPALATTPEPQLTLGCSEGGSGLDPATFSATLDGRPLEGGWSSAAGCAVLTVDRPLEAGTHILAVEGSDGAGNRGSATFEIEVRFPPGQAV